MTHPITTRLAGAAILVLTLSAAPVLAVDTGGEDTTPTTSSSAEPSKPAGPTLEDARADISAKNWTKAISDLKTYVAAHPSSADGFNLLGYSYRNAGNYDLAGKAYAKALKLDPKHTGALEYQGVLFIKLGQMDKAKANLAKIKAISGEDSEEYKDLAEAIG